MEKISRYMLAILLTAFVIILCACSVKERQEKNYIDEDSNALQMDVDFGEPLRVFYEDAGLLMNFSNLYPDIELELCKIFPNWENEELDIEYWAEKCGDPDIVLLNDQGGFDLEEEYEKGQVEDIGKYCAEDETLVESNYVGGTFEILNNGEAIMGLPLSWYKQCLIVKESELMNSELEALPENYTGQEFFTALVTEIKKDQYAEKFCWLDPIYFYSSLREVAPRQDGKFEMDEEMFKVLFEFSVQNEINYEEAKGVFEEVYGDFGAHCRKTQGKPALDPDLCRGGYYGTYLMGAPQVMAIYAKSVAAMDQEDVEFFWIPTADNGNEYVGLIRDYAFIGKNSARKQQAYEVIRMMMDMPVTIMTQPSGVGSEIYSSVNIEQSLGSLDYFNSLEQELNIWNRGGDLFYKLDQQKLSENELEGIRRVIKGISRLYVDLSPENNLELIACYNDYMSLCIENGKIDHTICYAEMQEYFTSKDEATKNHN